MDLRRIDLNLLVAFDALMAERSVTRAAQRLSIGQSAMSSTLARLRRLFDDPILIREGRGLMATPLAEALAEPVAELLAGIEGLLSHRDTFDPATAQRTFSIIASDYVTMTFLQPLIAALATEAPGIRLRISPTSDDAPDRLRRNLTDLLVIPREAFTEHARFPHHVLIRDRYLVAVDKDHPEVRDHITLEQFSRLPYLATASGQRPSLQEMQLDFLGIPRNTEITAEFGLAPFLLAGTQLVTLIHEALARRVGDAAGIRVFDPPIPGFRPITEIMAWTSRTEGDAGNKWLRQRLIDLTVENHGPAAG